MRASIERYRLPPGRKRMTYNKPDSTSKLICQTLRDAGAKVTQIASASGEKGIPDILVSHGGRWYVAEIKAPKGVLSTEQVRWHAESRAKVHILKTVTDALSMIGVVAT